MARLGAVKSLLLSFQDNPSATVVSRYNAVRAELPRTMQEGNAWLLRAMTLSQALAKYDLKLSVPAPVK
jgi:hypothetical protein